MHAILASIGTDGDIYPYLGLGAVLRARGHRVTLAASEDYGDRAAAHGFGFAPLISAAENHALLSNPDFWHPLKGGKVGADWGAPLVERQFELLDALAREPDALLIAALSRCGWFGRREARRWRACCSRRG
jgi:rhamnosyltransferase subunit B